MSLGSRLRWLAHWPGFARDFLRFRRLAASQPERFPLRWGDRHPCLDEATRRTDFDRHYILHCAWAARVLARTKPARHVDIGSSLAFSTQVSAFLPVDFYDFRPAHLRLDNFTSGAADLLRLPFPDGGIASLSCLHTVEHVGLGRYGDALDPDGDRRAVGELIRVLAPGGRLLLVVPLGRPAIHFNAHRIYAPAQVRELGQGLELEEFVLIPDDPADGDLVAAPAPALLDRQIYGCGCFLFRRPA